MVAKDYSQKASVDYNEVFAHVARLQTIRLIISLTTQNKWKIHQIDVKSAIIDEVQVEVCVQQPLGYKVKGHEKKNLEAKDLYGLKQAP